MRPRTAPWLAMLAATACGGGKADPPPCESLAAVVARCDARTTAAEWLELCGLAVLSDDCRRAIESASCSQHARAVPSYRATCFPACDPASAHPTCEADATISQCVGALGGTVRYRCAAVCAAAGKKQYTGTCGREYQGHAATGGQAACWCE